MSYNYFRDYDPQTGRYLESDPIGLAGGNWSTYAYTAANPVNNSDPSGLFAPPPIPWPIAGAAVGVVGYISYGFGTAIYNTYANEIQDALAEAFPSRQATLCYSSRLSKVQTSRGA
jgi:uncharacterized protein RhaS with RHS repeats